MRELLAAFLLTHVCTTLPAQAPAFAASEPDSRAYSDPLGFSYSLPAEWQVADTHASSSAAKDRAAGNASIGGEKKGMECLEAPITARRGNPASVIVEVLVPFDCFGQAVTQEQLPGFGADVAAGMRQSADIANPMQTTYTLGSHHLWAQRSTGNLKGKPDTKYTIEVACGLLKKAAVCWVVMAADDAALADFEHGAVTLEDDPPAPLVPAGAFKQ